MAFILTFSLYYFYCVNWAHLSAGIAFDTQISDHLMLFVWPEQNGIGRTFLCTFGATNAQIIDLVFDQTLTFA